jgi:hypothetical protein
VPGVAPIAYQSSDLFHPPRVGASRCQTEKESAAAGDITIVRPQAAAPPRRRVRVSLQVEMRRARFFGTHAPRDKEHHLASRKCRRESTPQQR